MTDPHNFNADLAAVNEAMTTGEVDAAIETAREALNELIRLRNDRNTGPVIALRLPQLGSLAVMIELIRTDIIVTADRKTMPALRVVGGLKHEGN